MLVLLLGGCLFGGGMGAGLGQPACEVSTDHEWKWSPVRFVIAADNDGTFEVGTGWDNYPVISGSWGEESLAYEEHAQPGTGSSIESLDEVGTLEVLQGGDYRQDVTQTIVDVHDVETTVDYQVARTGCVESMRVIGDDYQYDQTSKFYVDRYRTVGMILWTDGTSTYEETVHEDGAWSGDSTFVGVDLEETQHREGDWTADHFVTDFDGDGDGFTYDGTREDFLDGSSHLVYTGHFEDGYWWKYDETVDYDGNGSGTYTNSNDTECELTYVENELSCDCNGDEEGPCD